MNVIVCLDDRDGMMFNRRRQSRDRYLVSNLAAYLVGKPLYLTPSAYSLFADSGADCVVTEHPLEEVSEDGYCLAETEDPAPYADKLTELVIYRWNRLYPSDLQFKIDLGDFRLTETTEFVGYAHEKITREVWKR